LGLPSLLLNLLPPTPAGWVLRLAVRAVATWVLVRRKGDPLHCPYVSLRQVDLLSSVDTLLLSPALSPWYVNWPVPLLYHLCQLRGKSIAAHTEYVAAVCPIVAVQEGRESTATLKRRIVVGRVPQTCG